ncbi:MAG: ribosome maturation factor RimM [Bacteroidaceae bacterium]|nr:ribosome maturation factor RimM [Bacteroidaceae bacterium]
MIAESDVYKIGSLTRTHGVRGEVAFQFTDDVWDRVEADYLFLRLDGLLVPFFLEEWRFRSDTTALVKFEDIDDVNAATRLVGAEVFFPKALTPEEVDEEDLTWQHFMGFEVLQNEELRMMNDEYKQQSSIINHQSSINILGRVTAVYDQTANILLEVTTPDGHSILIPAHEDFILRADHRDRRLYVNVPADLLTLNS